jgi:hypothetical protein
MAPTDEPLRVHSWVECGNERVRQTIHAVEQVACIPHNCARIAVRQRCREEACDLLIARVGEFPDYYQRVWIEI